MTSTAVRDRRTLWKSVVIVAAAVMLIGVLLPGSARAADAPVDSARHDLMQIVTGLTPPVGADAVHHFDKAVDRLDQAIADDGLWGAAGEPGAKGAKVFKKSADAAKELVKAGMPDDADLLAEFARGLADDAMAVGTSDKAGKHYAKAVEELGKGKPEKAIDHFGKAWKYALKASASPLATSFVDDVEGWLPIDSAQLASNGFTGTGYVYTFQFIDAAGELLVVSGWSTSNEGFLNSDRFNDADTYLPGTQMQVHVSCSDAFTGGIGQKSDPTAVSQWLVDYARIIKYSNGEVAKSCLLTGKGSGNTTPPVFIG